MVGAAVDDDDVLGQLGSEVGGRPVWQGEKHDVVPAEGLRRGRFEHPVADGGEVRVDVAQPFPRLRVGRQRAEPDLWVPQQQPDDLTTGVPAGAGDCCDHHAA